MNIQKISCWHGLMACVCLGMLVGGSQGDSDLVTAQPERARINQADIDAGKYAMADLIGAGRELVIRNWMPADGFGSARSAKPMINRLCGPDSTSCISCHGLGNAVVMGWGSNAANVLVELDDQNNPTIGGSNERNTPAAHGLVLLELLAKEMSRDLQILRAAALTDAKSLSLPVTRDLMSKGVRFGQITVHPDGSVDTSAVEGVDPDLRIRPFHAKGHGATIRLFTRDALDRHHGIQATEFLKFKDPSRDSATWDADGDGIVNEVNEGELTAMTVYQVSLPIPQEVDHNDANIANGRALMESVGCTECHRPFLQLNDPVWSYTSSHGVKLSIDLTDSNLLGAGRPTKEADGSVLVRLWGDLKRYDLGPKSHEPLAQPVSPSRPNHEAGTIGEKVDDPPPPIAKEMMLTTELWGLRDTGPWWHDGCASTIERSIRRHGGDAEASRLAYDALSDDEKDDLLAFLESLQVAQVGEILVTAPVGSPVSASATEE